MCNYIVLMDLRPDFMIMGLRPDPAGVIMDPPKPEDTKRVAGDYVYYGYWRLIQRKDGTKKWHKLTRKHKLSESTIRRGLLKQLANQTTETLKRAAVAAVEPAGQPVAF